LKYFKLGNNGPNLSQIGLGTMMMGWRTNRSESKKILSAACDLGITFIDTSVSYSRGFSHEIIGKSLASLKIRDKFTLATKVGGVSDDTDPIHHRGYSKKNIIRQCELSLRQLKTERIDILQLHYPTSETSYAEMLEALSLLIYQGKIKNYGLSNYNKDELNALCQSAEINNFQLPISNQFECNLLNYKKSQSFFEACSFQRIGSITWGPLSSGLLSNWYIRSSSIKPGSRIDNSREKNISKKILHKVFTKKILLLLGQISKETGITVQVLAISWLIHRKPNNCILIGPSNLKQLIELSSISLNNQSIFYELDLIVKLELQKYSI